MTNYKLEALYGPAAHYSEHMCGDVIIYLQEDLLQQGTILFVAARESLLDKDALSPQYVVLPVYNDRFTESVFPANIVNDPDV